MESNPAAFGGDDGTKTPPVCGSGGRLVTPSELAEALDCGDVDPRLLKASAAREAAHPATVDPRDELERDHLFRRRAREDPLAAGRWVRVHGLEAQELNGKSGIVVRPIDESSGRIGVRISGLSGASKLIKARNLAPYSDEETVEVVRLFCSGERESSMQTGRWPLRLLSDRPFELSTISARIGVPLHVTRVEPLHELAGEGALENQWVGHLMVDDRQGFVKRPWDSKQGPVVVWRADCGPLTADDLCLVVCFIDSLLPRYADKGTPMEADKEVTPEAFCFFRANEEACKDSVDGRGKWWDAFLI